jgi:hypothetical protein
MRTLRTRNMTIFDAMILVAATAAGFALLQQLLMLGFFFNPESVITRYVEMARCANEVVFPFLSMWTLALFGMGLRQPRPPLRRLARQPGMAACAAASLALAVPLLAIVIPEIISCVRAIHVRATLAAAIGFDSNPKPTLPRINLGTSSVPDASSVGSYGSPPGSESSASAGAVNVPSGTASGEPPGQFPSIPGLSPARTPSGFFSFVVPDDPYPREPFFLWYILRAVHRYIILRAHIAAAVAGAWLTLLMAGWWRPERSWIDRLGRALGFTWIAVELAYAGAPLLGW